ncbi:hypothetical protein AMJ44_11000, partial [candidate division WOR-1 bacterium DG_54_3]
MERLLTVQEAADSLQISESTVYRLCTRGLPHIKKSFGLRFRQIDLEKWLDYDKRKAIHADNILTNALTNSPPLVIDKAKGGKGKLAKKKPTCFNYGFGHVRLRTYKSRNTCWTIDYRDENSKRIQKALPYVQNKEEAALTLQKEVANVFNRRHGIERRRGKIKFRAFSEIYLQYYAMIVNKSWKTDAGRLKILEVFFKNTELREITPLDVERFRKSRLKAGNTKSTCNRYMALLKRMFNVAREEGYVEKNPVQKVKFYSEKDTLKERILTEDEEKRLLGTCSDNLKPILLIALNTGMRRAEIFNLQWSQVDLKSRRIRVEKAKSGKLRFIPVNDVLFNELCRLRNNQSPFVFFNPDTMKPYVDMKKGFKAACRRVGIAGLRFHDLRHTFASRLVEKGIDIETVRDLLG